MAQLTKIGYSSALVLKLYSCLHFVVVAVVRLKIESHKNFSVYCMEDNGANKQLNFVVMIIRLQIIRRL